MKKYLNVYCLIAVVFILGVIVSGGIWLYRDNSIEGDGSQNHLVFFIEFFYELAEIMHSKTFSLYTKIIRVINLLGTPIEGSGISWPNGLSTTASVFYYFFGKSLFSAKLSLMPYLIILLLSTYLIGRTLFSDFVGLLAMFLLYMYPLIFESFRQFQLDSPLTAMVALSILFLIKCNDFTSRKYSLLLGVSLGWGMLVKGQVILYIIWPLCFVLYRACRHCWVHPLRSKQLQNIGIFMLLSVMIASLWWGHSIKGVLLVLNQHVNSSEKALEPYWSYGEKYSFESISYYIRGLLTTLGPPFYIMFLISFLFFLKQKVKHKGILMSWFIPPLLVFSFVFIIKQPRFLMPILSPMAMITAWGLGHIKSKKIRLPIVSVVIVFCVMQFSVLSYGSDGMRNISVGTFKIFGKPYYGGRCRIEDLKIDTLIQIIAERSSSNELIQIGSVNVTGARPDNLEIVFWLRMENDFLKPVDLVEMYAWFLKDFDSLDFIVFHTHSASELMWPGGEEFKTLLRRHNPNGIQVIEAIDPLRWNSVLERLENARLDFNLIGTIPKAEAIYYIYERNNRGH